MYQILLENILLTAIIISLIIISIVGQVLIGAIYQRLINEAENLSTTDNKHLKLCKLKFQNCYQLNGNVPNIPVFVDKFISRLTLFGLSLNSLRRLASQMIMLAVFTSGCGVCFGIIAGETMFRLLPYYILAIVGLYIYFSVAALVDIPNCRETLKINLMDHLENHLLSRLKNNFQAEVPKAEQATKERKIKPVTEPVKEPEITKLAAQFTEDEIEELLKELII